MLQSQTRKQETGFALILALIVSSVALAIGLSLLDITIKQLTLSTTSRESELAFQAAAAGLDCLVMSRNLDTNAEANGQNLSIDCLGWNATPLDSDGNVTRQRYSETLDWDTPTMGDQDLCIDLELVIINASSSAATISTTNSYGGNIQCSAGSVCSFGYARGHNRDCNSLASIFVVQRELTAEF